MNTGDRDELKDLLWENIDAWAAPHPDTAIAGVVLDALTLVIAFRALIISGLLTSAETEKEQVALFARQVREGFSAAEGAAAIAWVDALREDLMALIQGHMQRPLAP